MQAKRGKKQQQV
jgi:DNA repair protein RAD51